MRALILFGIIITALFIVGCSSVEDSDYLDCPPGFKGAQYCTMEYEPVCGEDGNTYSNVCVACRTLDKYKPGVCPGDEELAAG